jgi:predicted nucleotidyltransferase component of viral defense system
MTRRLLKDVAASVRQRLLNKARESGRPFNEVLQYYAMERFLFRLSKSRHSRRFVLKGALMINVWKGPLSRPTMDIDLLGRGSNAVEDLITTFKEICLISVEPDGLAFDPDSIEGERIVEDADYEGVRIRFRANLGNSRISMQIDVAFGDVIVPSASAANYPSVLDSLPLALHGYSRESAIAEKFQVMVKLGYPFTLAGGRTEPPLCHCE